MRKIMSERFSARFLRLFLGIFLISCGIYMFINSQLGSDPITVLVNGLATTTGLTVGQTSFVINGFIILFLLLATGKKFGPGTFLHAIFVGVFLDLLFMFPGEISPNFIVFRAVMLAAAVLLIGSGIAIYISAEMGEGALEALLMFFRDKTGFSFKSLKVTLDVIFGGVGVLLGATFGIGTVLGALAIGPVAQSVLCVVNDYRNHYGR